MKMLKKIPALVFALTLATALLIAGCASEGPSTTSVEVGMTFPDAPTNAIFNGTVDQIATISVRVTDGESVWTQDLTEISPNVWTGTFSGLWVGVPLDFTARAYDAGDSQAVPPVPPAEIFNGSQIGLQLSGDPVVDVVNIRMDPFNDGVDFMFPIINQIVIPGEIVTSTTVATAITLTANAGETLAIDLTAPPGSGTFGYPTSQLMPTATTTLNSTYIAPWAVGVYPHSLRVTNEQGNSVETVFSTNVVPSITGVVVDVFSPVVTALSASRSGSNVTFNATVSDDNSPLTYAWGFTQSVGPVTPASFSVANLNPGVLSGYDQTVEGTVSMTVSDGVGGITTITFGLNAGQFPDTLVLNCPVGDATQMVSQVSTASMWFGGEDRVGLALRNVGAGQSITPPNDFPLKRFAFNLTGGFPVDVTLVLNIRAANGAILATAVKLVTPAYTGGWIFWDVDLLLTGGTNYIFTSYLQDGYVLGYWTNIWADGAAGYPGGVGYSAQVNTSTDSLGDWLWWGVHSWDFDFWAESACNL